MFDFPVLQRANRIASSSSLSQTLRSVPIAAANYVFVAPALRADAEKWITSKRDTIITPQVSEE